MSKRKKPMTDPDELVKFQCQGCGFTGYDVPLYFGKSASLLCLWCNKYGKPKQIKASAPIKNA